MQAKKKGEKRLKQTNKKKCLPHVPNEIGKKKKKSETIILELRRKKRERERARAHGREKEGGREGEAHKEMRGIVVSKGVFFFLFCFTDYTAFSEASNARWTAASLSTTIETRDKPSRLKKKKKRSQMCYPFLAALK